MTPTTVYTGSTGLGASDRQLLEDAAKAAGIAVIRSRLDDPLNRDMLIERSPRNPFQATGPWNPLLDDGDALRVAVTKRFTIKDFAPFDNPEIVQVPPDGALWGMVEIWQQDGNDPLHVEWYRAGADRIAATRRAIVRAAAAIGAKS